MAVVALSSLSAAELLARYESVMAEAIRWNHMQPPTAASKARAAGLLATAKAMTTEMQGRAKVGLGVMSTIIGVADGVSGVLGDAAAKTFRIGSGAVAVAAILATVYLFKK